MRPLHDDLLCAHPAFVLLLEPTTRQARHRVHAAAARRTIPLYPIQKRDEKIFISSSATCSPSLPRSTMAVWTQSWHWTAAFGQRLQGLSKWHCEISLMARQACAGTHGPYWLLPFSSIMACSNLLHYILPCCSSSSSQLQPERPPPGHTISTAANLCLHGHGSQLTAVDPLPH